MAQRPPLCSTNQTQSQDSDRKSKVAPGSSYDNPIKVVVMGSGPGRSAVVLRLVTGRFVEDYDGTLAEWYRHQMGDIYLDIYDTASCDGENDFERQAEQSHAVLIMFSIASRAAFDCLGGYLWMFDRFRRSVPFVLVGTQKDLETERQVPAEEAQALAAANKEPYIETSAKTGQGVSEVFQVAINMALKSYNENKPQNVDAKDKDTKHCTIQ